MTFIDVLGIARRRWYAVVLGLLLTALVVGHVATKPGVYWARTSMTFLAPVSAANPNAITTASQSVAQTAGVIAQQMSPDGGAALPVSPDVTLADQGVRHGYQVFQPNYGGQWTSDYSNPKIIIDVTGSSASEVATRTIALRHEIHRRLTLLQAADHVDRRNRITAKADTAVPQVIYDVGRPKVAMVVSLLLGLLLTLQGALWWDRLAPVLVRWLRRRRMPARVARPSSTSATA